MYPKNTRPPTLVLIVLGDQNQRSEPSEQCLTQLHLAQKTAEKSPIPALLVTPAGWGRYIPDTSADFNILEHGHQASLFAYHEGLSAAVSATPDSSGWIVATTPLTEDTSQNLPELILQISKNVIVSDESSTGLKPLMGFNPELYTELAKIKKENDLARILLRYPVTDIQYNHRPVKSPL